MFQNIFEELIKEIESYKDLPQHYLISKGNDNGFENLVIEKICPQFNSRINQIIPNHKIKLIPQFGAHFPDLDLKIDDAMYGIELKSRKDGSWQTQGGSAFESTSGESYKEIYLLFASRDDKKGEKSYKVRYAPYWKAAEAIRVTHSPRFSINLDATSSVFSSNDEYNRFHKLPKEEKSKFIQKTLAKTVTKPTWYSNPNDIVMPTFFSELDKNQKEKLRVEALILFSDDLLHQPRANYHRITEYLLNEYYVVNPSTRDMFTAGGQIEIESISFPKIIEEYQKNQKRILQTIKNNKALSQVAYEYWQWPKDCKKITPIEDFKSHINKLGKKYFKSNLKKINSTLFEIMFSDFE